MLQLQIKYIATFSKVNSKKSLIKWIVFYKQNNYRSGLFRFLFFSSLFRHFYYKYKKIANLERLAIIGATGENRTPDLQVTNLLLYQLSYSSVFHYCIYLHFNYCKQFYRVLYCINYYLNIISFLYFAVN